MNPQAVDTEDGQMYPRLGDVQPSINRYLFVVDVPLSETIGFWRQQALENPEPEYWQYMLDNLDSPSGCLPYIILPSHLDINTNEPKKWRKLGIGLQTTNREVIQKILRFYSHKTFRRCMRNHLMWSGFTHQADTGPLKADVTLIMDEMLVV
jgi:hypothetical protein